MTLEEFLDRLENVHQLNHINFMARCPAHPDDRASLSISDGGDKILVCCHADCATAKILQEMGIVRKDGGPDWGALWYENEYTNGNQLSIKHSDPEAEYVYTDEKGNLLYKVVRYPGKRFKQERRFVPYRLPALLEALPDKPVFIVEGEKDVHALESHGRLATCNAGGAGSWKDEWAPIFARANVIVWADKDEPGLRHAFAVADSLFRHALTIKVVQSYVGKDAYDHLEAGYAPDAYELIRLVKGQEVAA